MTAETFDVDLYWSFRSPYCYFLLDRIHGMERDFYVRFNVKPIYPMAVRAPAFFKDVNPKYRTYHTADCVRVARYLNMPFRRPIPDPIVQNLETSVIAPEQPYIRRITRAGAAGQMAGKGLDVTDKIARLIWDGKTDNWHEGLHIKHAIDAAGLDGEKVLADIDANPDRYDALIAENQAEHDASSHWGLPTMVFRGETFYGQDRLELLLWRMTEEGLQARL